MADAEMSVYYILMPEKWPVCVDGKQRLCMKRVIFDKKFRPFGHMELHRTVNKPAIFNDDGTVLAEYPTLDDLIADGWRVD